MKNAPFLLSSLSALVAVIFSIASFFAAQKNNSLQDELRRKQSEIQDLTQAVTLQNQDFERMNGIIQTGAQVAQKAGPPILRDMGYFAAKGDKDMQAIMNKYKHQDFIMKPEDVKEVDKQIAELQVKQGGKPAPANNTPPPATGNPAPRLPNP